MVCLISDVSDQLSIDWLQIKYVPFGQIWLLLHFDLIFKVDRLKKEKRKKKRQKKKKFQIESDTQKEIKQQNFFK